MIHGTKNIMTGNQHLLILLKSCFLVLVFQFAGIACYAQGQVIPLIKGTVKGGEGELLAGASVSVQAAKIFATTKKDGTFELRNVPEGAVLRVSHVGHSVMEIKLKPGQTEVAIRLAVSANVMGEVVVNTGLYKRSAGSFTGASKTYTGEELKMVNPNNILKALAVVEPSVRMQENNALGSDPNQLPVIQVRGQNNLPVNTQGSDNATSTPVSNGDIMSGYLLNPNQPLIILDGFQTTLQTIYDMDINRIATITVLKDASATTAYGSKAANGVIVVETKQPLAGKTQISYSINTSLEAPDLTSYHLLDAEGLLEAQRLAGVYSDPNNHFNDIALNQWYDYRLKQVKSGVNTYWLSQPVQTGFGISHSLNISGGARALRYALSLSYNFSQGVMKGSDRRRFGLNYNLSYTTGRLKFSNNTNIGYSRGNNSPWGSFNDYAKQFPFFKPYDSAGNVIKVFEPNFNTLGIAVPAPGGIMTNAAYNAQLDMIDYSDYWGFTNNSNFDWTISNELRMRAALSFSNNLPGSEMFLPADHTIFATMVNSAFTDFGTYNQVKGKNNVIDGRISLDYHKKIGKTTISSSVGFQAQEARSNSTSIRVSGIPNDYLDQLGMANGYGTATRPGSTESMVRSVSTYSSTSYNYADRYTAELTLNASGSSQFGSNNRLAPFWAGGIAWNVDKEKFFKKNDIIQSLRIRLTTGITGNQNFSAYLTQPTFLYNIQNNYRLQLGATVEGYANPDLKWQQTIKRNLGVSSIFFNGRLNVGFDYYEERTENLILPLDVAPSSGFITYSDNLGATKNSGFEISLSSPIIRNRKKDIHWTLGVNAGHFSNVITKLSPAIDAINKANNADSIKQNAPLPRFEVGQSMSRIWVVPSLGIDPATGKEVFVKRDGSRTFVWDANDKLPLGDATPIIKGNISSSFAYKGFVFNINMGYQYGGQLYNQTLVDKIENVDLLHFNADERVLSQRWKKPGDHVAFKSLVKDGTSTLQLTKSTSRFLQDNNYLEASSITFGYTFPSNLTWVKKMRLSTPRFFITQNNVFRFANIKTERGTGYPFARSFSFGLSTTF
jgi:TonB-linked SusC/RagA family outer membrane protein